MHDFLDEDRICSKLVSCRYAWCWICWDHSTKFC